MRRRLLSLLVALVASAGLLGAGTASARSAAIDYVALGDSYASGVGTRSYDRDSGSCLRSPSAYPELWAGTHPVASFVFAACSGATTADVMADQLEDLSAATDLVTVSVGGNDAGFARVMTECQIGGPARCDTAIAQAQAFIADELPARLDAVYHAIRERASTARILVMGYPQLFEVGPCLTSISPGHRARLNGVADQLATVTADRAAGATAEFVDTRTAFIGHRVCALDAWINGPTYPARESYHPDVDGHADAYLPALVSATG